MHIAASCVSVHALFSCFVYIKLLHYMTDSLGMSSITTETCTNANGPSNTYYLRFSCMHLQIVFALIL